LAAKLDFESNLSVKSTRILEVGIKYSVHDLLRDVIPLLEAAIMVK